MAKKTQKLNTSMKGWWSVRGPVPTVDPDSTKNIAFTVTIAMTKPLTEQDHRDWRLHLHNAVGDAFDALPYEGEIRIDEPYK